MKRVTTIAVGTALLAGTVMAVAPWTVSSGALNARVADQLRQELGLDLKVEGRTTIAFLPVPRVKFDGVTLTGAGGEPVARGGQLRGQLSLLPLFAGQIVLTEASLSNSRIELVVDRNGRSSWDPAAAALRARIEQGSGLRIDRFVVNHANVVHQDDVTGARNLMRDVNLVINWPAQGSSMEVGGAFEWRGETVQVAVTEVAPAALAAGHRSPVELRLTSRLGRLSILGSMSQSQEGPWLSGRTAFETRSLRDLLAWAGVELPLGALIGAATLDGEVRAVGPVVSWPAVRLSLAGERLDGALTARIEDGRLAVNGTLAADSLDLTGFAAPFSQALGGDGGWSTQPLSLAAATSCDLDLRLSATVARVGKARLEDLALNTIIKPGRIEAALARATLNGGSIKGRVSVSEAPGGAVELKAQASGQAEMAALLTAFGSSPWMTGASEIQFALESLGDSPAELARRANGRASVVARHGEFVGVSLEEALRRFERQPLSASLNLRHGRTTFSEAQASLVLADGIGEITGASFTSQALRGEVRGHVIASERTIAAKAAVESLAPVGDGKLVSALAFDIGGGWHDIAIIPDAKALIQRSGAARLLLGAPAAPPAGPAGLPRVESSAQ